MSNRVVLVGLGATGLAMAQSLLRRSDFEVVGVSDKNLAHVGADLGTLIGDKPVGLTVVEDIADLPKADLAIVATTSDLNLVANMIVPLLARSFNVLSICEELAYPWKSHPEVAQRLNDLAVANGVTVLGTGANPGVLMDTLPLLLTTLTQDVRRVEIRRRTNMSRYGAILSKFGLGLTRSEFDAAQSAGDVVGHNGFEQAISALATGLGWKLDNVEVDDVTPAVTTSTVRAGEHVTIVPGQISAVTHAARGVLSGRVVIDLEITFGFFSAEDSMGAGDDYLIEGTDQNLTLSSGAGFESFLSTIAAAVNTAAAVVEAPAGLLSMGDLSPRSLASKGALLNKDGAA